MEKYIVKIDRRDITTAYYEIEAESEEEALSIAAHGGEKVKFLFDSYRDGGEGKPEIDRSGLSLEQLKRLALESKCYLDLSTGMYIGPDYDGDLRILGEEQSGENALLLISLALDQKDAEEKLDDVLDKYAAIPTSEAGPDVADSMMRELRDALSEYGKSCRDIIYDTSTPLGKRIDKEWFRLMYYGR